MSSSSFPLMKLPYIPLKEIVMRIPLCQLLEITLDPKFYRLLGIRKNFDLYLDDDRWIVSTDEIDDVACGYGTGREVVNMMNRWEKIQKAIPGSIRFFTVCRRNVKDLLVCDSLPKEVNVFVFDWIVDSMGCELRKEDPSHFSFYWNEESEEYKEELMKAQKEEDIHIEKLLSLVNVRKGFVLYGTGRPKTDLAFEKEYIHVEYSDWVTLEMLPKLKSRVACLERSILENEEANRFLKDFKAGKVCQNLEILTISGYDYDPDWDPQNVMEGLDAKRESEFHLHLHEESSDKEHNFIQTRWDSLEMGIDLTGAYTFNRIDGFTCSVIFERKSLIMYVYKREENDINGRKKQRMEENIEKSKRRRDY